MKANFFKDWKFILFISVLILYSLFFSVLYKQEVKTFVEGWSRELVIAQIKDQQASELMNVKNIKVLPIEKNKNFVTIWYENKEIHYSIIDAGGEIISTKQLNLTVPGSNKLEAILEDDIIQLYNLDKKDLYQYSFNINTGEVKEVRKFEDRINDITVKADSIIYGSENSLTLITENKPLSLSLGTSIISVKAYNALPKNLYHLAFVEESEGRRLLKYVLYNPSNNSFATSTIDQLPSQNGLSVSQTDIAISNENVHVLVSSTNIKSKKAPMVEYYKFNYKSPEKVTSHSIRIDSFAPNPRIIDVNDQQLSFIASEDIKKGSMEVTGLSLYTIENDKILNKDRLTNTDDLSINPQYFILDGHKYMVWPQQVGNSRNILLASDHPKIIIAANKLKSEEWMKLFADTILGFIPILFIALIPFMFMFLPVCVLMFIMSIFKLTWMENNATLVLRIGIASHLLIKAYYTITNFTKDTPMSEGLPEFLGNPVYMFLLIIATTMMAVYCTISYIRKRGTSHFFMSYTFFAVVDTLLYSLLFLPYYYANIILSYFTKIG